EDDGTFPEVLGRVREYITGGIGYENEALAAKCMKLLEALPHRDTLVHGDFHTGNVFLQNGEALLIDMDRISRGHPIIELSDLYYFYNTLGVEGPEVIEGFMGFSYDTAKQFFKEFLKVYLGTDDEKRLAEVTEKASMLGYARLIRKLRKKGKPTPEAQKIIDDCVKKLEQLVEKIDTLEF
ncbi:MAG: phosphotransferase, partial [Firmicutes bacterium]|nr:phosphotransferase [Bacillota bacterium]